MANKNEELKLIRMNEVEATTIDWLWYPYIPFGKITVIQGDPGDGKTTAVLAIAAAVTTGALLPESKTAAEPMNVIFQTAEDGLGDTVKPRLIQSGADCTRVIVIDESEKELSLSDLRIEQAITQTGAKLFILDPLQAYIGADVDMHRANEIRPVLKRISAVAEKTGCAVVVIGHLNKGGSKSQYRGLGSIDIQAAAVLDKKIEKKEARLEKLDEKITIKEKAAATVAEIDAMGKPALLGGFNVSADEKVSDMRKKLTSAETERDTLKTEKTAAKKAQPTISEHLTWFNKFMAALKRAPKRLMAVIEDILRQPPEKQEQQPAPERKRVSGIEI